MGFYPKEPIYVGSIPNTKWAKNVAAEVLSCYEGEYEIVETSKAIHVFGKPSIITYTNRNGTDEVELLQIKVSPIVVVELNEFLKRYPTAKDFYEGTDVEGTHYEKKEGWKMNCLVQKDNGVLCFKIGDVEKILYAKEVEKVLQQQPELKKTIDLIKMKEAYVFNKYWAKVEFDNSLYGIDFDWRDECSEKEGKGLVVIGALRRYSLFGDYCLNDNYESAKQEIAAYLFGNEENINLLHEKYLIIPIYAYIHGGISLSLRGFSCPWDSGTAGFLLFDSSVWDKDKAKEYAEMKVKKLDAYYNYPFAIATIYQCNNVGEEKIAESFLVGPSDVKYLMTDEDKWVSYIKDLGYEIDKEDIILPNY